MAERVGFEPTNTFWDVTHFPGERLRPLGHLSTRAARVPEAAPAIKSAGTPSRPARRPTGRNALSRGGGLVLRCRLVTGRDIQAGVLRTRRRRRQLDGGDHESVLGIRRIQAFRDFERRYLHSLLIFLPDMAIRVQPAHDVAAGQQRRRAKKYDDSLKAQAACSSSVTPAARMARKTVSWCIGARSTNGRRTAPPMRPILATAHFTGMGLASTNKSLCRSCKSASMLRAFAKSPARAAAHTSLTRRGATFPVTEMTPLAPSPMKSTAVASSPDSSVKPAGTCASNSRARLNRGVASLSATIRGCRARRATVPGSRSTPVRVGTLYRTTGTNEASAAAMK